jgi:hypothetical protein
MAMRHAAGDRQPMAFEPRCWVWWRLMAMRHAAGDRQPRAFKPRCWVGAADTATRHFGERGCPVGATPVERGSGEAVCFFRRRYAGGKVDWPDTPANRRRGVGTRTSEPSTNGHWRRRTCGAQRRLGRPTAQTSSRCARDGYSPPPFGEGGRIGLASEPGTGDTDRIGSDRS